ncbi:hypothetical protein F442_16501 [Phytophthora nicotianae P10297]|uniref:Uncharacterized protein n=1 Tax=Phytophthora nicotianae P10297 TaxID=1317064 RepID=W2YM59_PHYNI|nr:hypothetical protein F442_16501 [Phytophthora nicotianae P10297]
MVRLTSRSFLHVLPELVVGNFDHPFYAQVTELNRGEVTFQSLEGGEGTLPRNVAAARVVTTKEVTQSGQLSYLRRPVAVTEAGQVHFGQVVQVDGDQVVVRSGGLEFVAPMGSASLVAPIIAIILQHVRFNLGEWTESEIEDTGSTILNRILGRSGYSGANSLPDVFESTMAEEAWPIASQVCFWIDPGTVEPIPATIGESFCRPPVQQLRQELPSKSAKNSDEDQLAGLFDPFVGDDDELPVGPSVDEQARLRPHEHAATPSNCAKPRCAHCREAEWGSRAAGSFSTSTRGFRKHSGIAREGNRRSTDLDAEEKRAPEKRVAPTSKYGFIPREDQQRVHERATAVRHKGKQPTAFCKGLIRSKHVKFKPLPGVCTRLFDLQFGSSGLSICHFALLSQDDRMAWHAEGGSNFDNLSASAESSAAKPATSVNEVVDAARVFLTYTREYCCVELVELVERIVELTEETLVRVKWSEAEVAALVYWINDLLEEFRGAAENGDDLRQVYTRCSTDDRLLKDLMFVKVHRQVDALRAETVAENARCQEQSPVAALRQQPSLAEKKRLGRIPRDVLRRLPVQVDPATGESTALCMRYVSKYGCIEKDGACPSEHGHFIPNTLHDVVKAEINKRFGGLKNEHKRL